MPKIRLQAAITEYEQHLRARGIEQDTTRNIISSLNRMFQVIGDVYVDKIDNRDMDRVFATYLWQASTRNNKLRIYKAFFRWTRARRYTALDFEPLFGWRNLTVPEKHRTRIPRDEWQGLFDQCQHPMERIVFATGLYLFLRASEQQRLQLKHVDLDRSEIEIYRKKTKKWDVMPITSELGEHMRNHLTWLAENGATDPNHFLIPTRNRDMRHDPVTRRWIAGTGTINPTRSLSKPHRIVQRILKKNGYEIEGEGEHTLRRSGARAYFDSLCEERNYDGALRRVQSMLGHTLASTTEIYIGMNLDRFARNKDLADLPMFPIKEVQHDNVVNIFRGKTS